jgi:hypothetical protein
MLLLLFAAAKHNFINFLCRLSLFSQKEKKRKERAEGLLFGEDDAKKALIFFGLREPLRERGQKPLFSPAKRIKRKTVANSTSLL